ncbi:MAG: hypothetical protein AAF696_27445 [Bacteroidota bacterium]
MRSGSKSFPTRNGECQIFSDRIEFHERGLAGKLGQWLYKKGFRRVSVLYALLFVAFTIAFFVSLWIENYFLAFFFFGAALMDLYALWSNRQLSLTPLIVRQNIQEVIFQKAMEGKARASIEVFFEDEGRNYKKKISLPSLMYNGAAVENSAYWILRDEGLIKT